LTGSEKIELLRIADALDATRQLIVATSMLVAKMEGGEGDPVHGVIIAAGEKLDFAREKLDVVRNQKAEDANIHPFTPRAPRPGTK
jgi:hypothetical protein